MPETLGRQADAGTSGNMQLDTLESVEFSKALCFMGRLLAGVFLMQREVKGPCLSGFFFLGRYNSLPAPAPHPPTGFPRPPSKYFEDLCAQPDLSVQLDRRSIVGGVVL